MIYGNNLSICLINERPLYFPTSKITDCPLLKGDELEHSFGQYARYMGEIIAITGISSLFAVSYKNEDFLHSPRAIASYTASTTGGLLLFFSMEAIDDVLPSTCQTIYRYLAGSAVLAARIYFTPLFREEFPDHKATATQIFGHFTGLAICFTALNFMEVCLKSQENIEDSNLIGIVYSGYMYHVIDSVVQGANNILENFNGDYIYASSTISTIIDPLLFIGLLKFSPLGNKDENVMLCIAALTGFGMQLGATITSLENKELALNANLKVVIVQQVITALEYIGATLAAEYIVKPATEIVVEYFQKPSLPGEHISGSEEL